MIRSAAVREYVNGSLWVWPGASAVVALLVGFAVSAYRCRPRLAVGAAGVPGDSGRRPRHC